MNSGSVYRLVAALTCATLSAALPSAHWPSNTLAGRWGKVQGLAAIDLLVSHDQFYGSINAVACPASGGCTIIGSAGNGPQSFSFARSPNGSVWTLNGGFDLTTLNCLTAYDCMAGGSETISAEPSTSDWSEAFVVSERNGVWGSPELLAPPSAFPASDVPLGQVDSIACNGPETCVIGGGYVEWQGPSPNPPSDAFVATEVGGALQTPIFTPVISSFQGVSNVVCSSQEDCIATAESDGGSNQIYSWVSGDWSAPISLGDVPGVSQNDNTWFASVSCPAVGNCAATGFYGSGQDHVFAVDEVAGVWGPLRPLDLMHSAANSRGSLAVSCIHAGDCFVVGSENIGDQRTQPFIAWMRGYNLSAPTVVNWTFGRLHTHSDGLDSISCTASGACAAAGFYQACGRACEAVPLVMNYVSGLWTEPTLLPGADGFAVPGWETPSAVACSVSGDCLVGGYGEESHVPGSLPFFSQFAPAPRISAMSSHRGSPSGGSRIVIYGVHFGGVSRVIFGRTPGTSVRMINSGALSVICPPGDGSVSVRVSTPGGTSAPNKSSQFVYV